MSGPITRSNDPRSALAGRTALVTGAGGGIGAGIAACLAEVGARVVVNDIDGSSAETVAELIVDAGGTATPIRADVADETAVERLMSRAGAAYGPVHILVNNVGVSHDAAPFGQLAPEDLERLVATNLRSQVLCCRAVLPSMIEQGWGRIINLSSRTWLGAAGLSFYSATKGAIVSFSRSLALEVGSSGVTVNAVAPGTIRSIAFDRLSAERIDALRNRNPAGRFGEPDDVGRAVCFLASPNAGAITGQLLHVCGGRSLYGGPQPTFADDGPSRQLGGSTP